MEAIIFDMDGVIIDSEPLWRKAMVIKINELFKKKGIDYNYTEKDCLETKGLKIDVVIKDLFQNFKLEFKDEIYQKLIKDIVLELKKLIRNTGKPMKGVMSLLKLAKLHKFKLGLASSSSRDIIDTVLEVLKLNDYFKVIYSGDDVKKTKPDPEIFQKAIAELNVQNNSCLIIEDSLNGLTAAVKSGAKVIAVPETHDIDKVLDNPLFNRVMLVESLEEVDHEFIEALCF